MRRFIYNAMQVILVMACIAACKKDGGISLSSYTLNYTSGEQKQTVSVTVGCDWTAAADCDWLICSPSSGSGNGSLSITTRINDNIARTATVTVSGGGSNAEITVNQEGIDFNISSYTLNFDQDGTPQTITITSRYDWSIDVPQAASWCKVEPLKGSAGSTEVTLSPAGYTDRTPRDRQFLTVNYNGTFSMLTISQDMPNNPPYAPELLSPEDGATGVKINGTFLWKAAQDPDGDTVKYTLMLSTDNGETWISYDSETTSCKPGDLLEKDTAYLWKVKGRDDFGGESESAVRSFTSSDGGAYADGEVSTYQRESAGAPKPVHLIIMGDGYVKDDYTEGGAFDRDVKRAVDAFFTPEPFATYRNHFRISTVAVYSEERGATLLGDKGNLKKQTRRTAFNTEIAGGSSTEVSCDNDKAYSYAKKVEGVTDAELQNTTVLMIVNIDVYAGTCWMERTGRSVSICPVGSTFDNVVVHEGGGHGFGRLVDEYRYQDAAIPETDKSMVADWRSVDPYYAYNISFSNNASEAHWGGYIGRSGYDAVGFYEGAMLYGRGVWRPEYVSCMEDNRMYYNAPSREAITRRIFKAAGKTFTMDEFYSKDIVRSDNTGTKAVNYVEDFIPLAPPVMINR
ncbi:MAG: M64 family metallo-endopeptidase [Clostridium sp.]|nr:M64 family metallo-endopeptidase [Bacteroides sp.]MCM1199052.1 M64 family metallo-endopeptidase [Clostridium sp.]